MKAFTRMPLLPLLFIGFAVPASAQQSTEDRPPVSVAARQHPSSPAVKVLTGKERLGPKWTDEQRIDDCNVPVEKRGRPRPTACTQSALGF
jgi:hypothetical protein